MNPSYTWNYTTETKFADPLYLRVPTHTTLYELRELLAQQLPFKEEGSAAKETENSKNEVETDMSDLCPRESENPASSSNDAPMTDPGLLVMRQIPMGYGVRKDENYTHVWWYALHTAKPA